MADEKKMRDIEKGFEEVSEHILSRLRKDVQSLRRHPTKKDEAYARRLG